MLLTFGDEFSPRALFAAGAQGVWYDPSDFSTLFQDSAGTTPVTAVGQPVGLMLDKSKGLIRGPELVSNGNFSSGATGWSTGTNVSITGGAAVFSSALNGANVLQAIAALDTAKSYEVTYTVVSITSGSVSCALGGTLGAIRSTPGTYKEIIKPAAATVYIRSRVDNTSAVIDNISAKELPGNHATQSTAASRPTIQDRYLSLDKVDDHLLVADGGAGTTGCLIAVGVMVPAAGTARTLFSDRGTNAGYKLGIDATNKVVFSGGTGAAFTTLTSAGALTAGTKYLLMAWHDGTNLNLSINGVAETPVAQGTVSAGTTTFTIGKDNSAASGYWGDRMYEMVYRKNDASTAAQRAGLYRYVYSKMGGL